MVEKLCIAICDDDESARRIIMSSVRSTFPGYTVEIFAYSKADILLADWDSHSLDLLLLDIDMPGMDGITLARRMRNDNMEIDIIYISNREDKVFESLSTEPFGFIRKSRFLEDMNEVLEHYIRKREKNQSNEVACLVVQKRTHMRKIQITHIIYVEGQGKAQLLHIEGETEPVMMYSSMQELEEKMVIYGFLRVHKGYLVNYRFINDIGQSDVLLSTGERIPVPRRKSQEVKENYLELMQENNSLLF